MRCEVDVPFLHAARLKRKRNVDLLRGASRVVVDLSSRGASPALRQEVAHGEWSVTAYWDGERFLAPVRDGADAAFARLAACPERWYAGRDLGPDDEVAETFRLRESEEEAVAAFLEAYAASGLVLVGDVLCEPCPEPLLDLDIYDRRFEEDGRRIGRGRVTVGVSPDRDRPSSKLRNLTRIAELTRLHGSRDFGFLDMGAEVLVPEAFRYDDEAALLADVAGSLVRGMSSDLGNADLAYFSAYAGARDRLGSWTAGGAFDADDVAAFCEAADMHDASRAWVNHREVNDHAWRRRLATAAEGSRFEAAMTALREIDPDDAASIEAASVLR